MAERANVTRLRNGVGFTASLSLFVMGFLSSNTVFSPFCAYSPARIPFYYVVKKL
jgi:hypothetical protein